MPFIEQTITIDAPPEEVWRLVGDPARIGEWVPALAGSSLEDNERTCTTADGGVIRERVLDHSDEGRHYTYEIIEAPLPVDSYRSTIGVEGHGDHSHVVWVAEFDAKDQEAEGAVVAAIEELYRQGLEDLRAQLERAA